MSNLAVDEDGQRETISEGRAPQISTLWAAWALGLCLFCAWALLSGWTHPITAIDLEQGRLNVALAPPSGGETIVQTFTPRHDGLHQVEILLAQGASAEGVQGRLILRLLDSAGNVVSEQQWPAAQLRHNQALALRFAPEPASEGQGYRLVLQGEGDNPFGAWAYDLDVLAGGELAVADATAGDLRLVTRYRLPVMAALLALKDTIAAHGAILLVSLLLLPLPGCLLLLAAGRRLPMVGRDVWWSLALVLGLAVWPILWLWFSLVGGRWSRGALAVVVAVGWLVALALGLWRREARPAVERQRPARKSSRAAQLLLVLVITLGLAVRLLAVRDLAFPAWVDSSRHGLITAVMVQNGRAPAGYAPFLAIDDFTYHFGFHTLAASVQMLGDFPLSQTLLALGQLLNGLAALSVYGAAWLLTRRRGAALLAAFLVALPFFFPAYYVTWGRYTQLTGALVLAPLAALVWKVSRGGGGWGRSWWVMGLLAAGLFLIHIRVFLVFLPFALLAWTAGLGREARLRVTRQLAAAGLLALALVAPRLWELAARAAPGTGFLSASGENYAEFPFGYVSAGWDRWFLGLGGAAFVILVVAAWRAKRGALAGVALGGWSALVALLLSGRVPGIPLLWLINLNSAYILIFVPLALLLAVAFAVTWSWLSRRVVLGTIFAAALGVGVAASALFGMQQQATILNETTILARPADQAAIEWVAQHTAPDALLAVNSWRWLGQTWAAGDGGAWLLPLTGREVTTPPVDYIGDRRLFEQVIAFNEGATAVEDWATVEAAEWLAEQGVTHVFVGARGGFLDPAALARNTGLELVYGWDGVFVFEVGGNGD